MRLEYFNTSASKCLFDIFKEIRAIKNQGADVNIQWFYEEDMIEVGEDYSSILDLPFSFIEYSKDLN